jgi:hypothetical protein
MPSPFPGMDPYLEQHWRDVHSRLVTLTSTALNSVLPQELVARVEERVVVDSVEYARPRAIFPDVRVYEDPGAEAAKSGAGVASSAVAEPIVLELEAEEHTETYVTILDASGGEVISAIEFLSPSNKLPGDSRDEYRRKRDELVAARVNFIEIDLVRQGRWHELLLPLVAPARVQTAYRVVIRRIHPRRRAELYPMSLRSPLPRIPIPLRENDADAVLDLNGLVSRAYEEGRYDHTDYTRDCQPSLDAEDAAWADGLLKAAGLRRAS